MKKLISMILVLCMAVMLVPVLAESADVTGEWMGSYAGHDIPLTLNADGTFSLNGTEGTWILEGETLSMTAQGETMVFTFKDDVISISMQEETLEFTRADAGEAAPAEDAAPAGEQAPAEEQAPAAEQAEAFTFADVNPAAAAEDFNGEWSIQYIAADGEVHANHSGEITADVAITDSGITFGSGFGISEFLGDKALKMEYADGAFSYSRTFFGVTFSLRVEMLQDGMAAVTIYIDGEGAILYMVRVDAAAEEPAA